MTRLTDTERETARREFYRIVTTRLDSRIERGEQYTSTRDLWKGYEKLHAEGFGRNIPPSQTVAAVLGYARYRESLYYARDAVTQAPQRIAGDRRSPYRVYLRPDATVPAGHVLVPIGARGAEIGEYIAAARGATDAGVHVTTQTPARRREDTVADTDAVYATTLVEDSTPLSADFDIVGRLTAVIKAQAEIIDGLLPVLSGLGGTGHPAL